MPEIQPIRLTLRSGKGATLSAQGAIHSWTRSAAMRRALQWAGAAVGVALLMLPIPIVHFASPLIALVGAPLLGLVVFKVYSGGRDLKAEAVCPDCNAPLDVRGSADRWPINTLCGECKASIEIRPDPATPATPSTVGR